MRDPRGWRWFAAWASAGGLLVFRNGTRLPRRRAREQGYDPCPPQGRLTVPPGETSATCGGLDPSSWLPAGVLLLAAGVVAHALADRSRRSV